MKARTKTVITVKTTLTVTADELYILEAVLRGAFSSTAPINNTIQQMHDEVNRATGFCKYVMSESAQVELLSYGGA